MSRAPAALPDGYIACLWCGAANRKTPEGAAPTVCFVCQLNPQPGEDPAKGGKVDPGKARASRKSRTSAPISRALGTTPVGQPMLGIDPGARYTGVVIRDGDVVLHSSTLVRPKELESGTDWALRVLDQIRVIKSEFGVHLPVAIEGISDPKGFQHGKQAAINPKDIIRAGIVLGALVAEFPDAVIIAPGNNGSQHYTHYPAVLIGRRPVDLPGDSQGAGTRGHEQSAYDVAGKGAVIAYPRVIEPLHFD